MKLSPGLLLPFALAGCTEPVQKDTGTSLDISFQSGPTEDNSDDMDLDCGELSNASVDGLILETTVNVTDCFEATGLSLSDANMEVAYQQNGVHTPRFPEPIEEAGQILLISDINITDILRDEETPLTASPLEIDLKLYGTFWIRRELDSVIVHCSSNSDCYTPGV